MSHHRHFMQRWLSVEHDDVIVTEMPLDLVANLQLKIGWFWVVAQINSLASIADDVFCAGVLVCTAVNEFLKIVNVESGHNFWVGEVGGDSSRNSNLIYVQIWVSCNHSSRRKVDSLSHQISADSPFFRFEPLRNRFQRSPDFWHAFGKLGLVLSMIVIQ